MSSLSRDPCLLPELTEHVSEVRTVTLAEVLDDNRVSEDFGVLLVDTEGWDLVVLQGLEHTSKRPRIIVTENFSATDDAEYRLLGYYGYHSVGCGAGIRFGFIDSGNKSFRHSLPLCTGARKCGLREAAKCKQALPRSISLRVFETVSRVGQGWM